MGGNDFGEPGVINGIVVAATPRRRDQCGIPLPQ